MGGAAVTLAERTSSTQSRNIIPIQAGNETRNDEMNTAENDEGYSEQKRPETVALSNTLCHRELVRGRDCTHVQAETPKANASKRTLRTKLFLVGATVAGILPCETADLTRLWDASASGLRLSAH